MADRGGEDRATAHARDAFISYASPDAAVADAVCAALERGGVTCWIAPRDVVPGEFYAEAIVGAIDSAKVIVLVLSQSAADSPHVLREVERASSKRRPIVSLRIDLARATAALEYFLNASQWLDASGLGVERAIPKLVDAVQRRIAHPSSPSAPLVPDEAVAAIPASTGKPAAPRFNWTVVALAAVAAAALAYFSFDRALRSNPTLASTTSAVQPKSASTSAPFTPPAHSIAVLPFVNMSGDPKQDYFSDGLSEELLNSLTTVRDLQVAARTSSFMFKDKNENIADIARKLNVGAVLEGSVRKDGAHVRITVQLINTATGFHLWSHTYDRDLKDILSLQTEIAAAVTQALQATLMADAAATIEMGGTQNPLAYDAYLRGEHVVRDRFDQSTALAGIAAFDEAIRLDPDFAKAYARRALYESAFAASFGHGAKNREHFERARTAAERALKLAPQLGEAHAALAFVLRMGFLDFNGALAEYERALELSPNDSGVLSLAAEFFADIGRADEAVAMARRGLSVDQLNLLAHRSLARTLIAAHRYRETIDAANRALSLEPRDPDLNAFRGLAFLQLDDAESARNSCSTTPSNWRGQVCMAVAYAKLHRRADAEAELSILKADAGDAYAYQYAEIHAQWGDASQALEWVETAYRLQDPGIVALKVDGLLDPVRAEPRFQAILRKLNYPN